MEQPVGGATESTAGVRSNPPHAPCLRRRQLRNLIITLVCSSLVCCLFVPPAVSESAVKIRVEVIVAHLTKEAGQIDTAAARLDRELRDQFRYGGIKVLAQKSFRLGVDEVWQDELQSGRTLMVKPLILEPHSALISVDVTGLVQTDLRVKNDQLVVIGAEAYRGGKLVIALVPRL